MSVLPMTTTSLGRIDLAQLALQAGFKRLSNRGRLGHVHFDALGRQRLNRPATHATTDNRIELVVLELIHWMTGPVIVTSIAVFEHRHLIRFRIVEREIGRRSKMLMNNVLFSARTLCGYT
jgi:hypothetical protein